VATNTATRTTSDLRREFQLWVSSLKHHFIKQIDVTITIEPHGQENEPDAGNELAWWQRFVRYVSQLKDLLNWMHWQPG
jgi:hypothetical protein